MQTENQSTSTKQTSRTLQKALPEEVIFTLLARDEQAPKTICEWIKQSIHTQSKDKLREAFEVALAMADQFNEINEKKRIADEKDRVFTTDQLV